jgi:hypothetical protein
MKVTMHATYMAKIFQIPDENEIRACQSFKIKCLKLK